LINWLSLAAVCALLPAIALPCLHALQLESYQLPGYRRFLREHGRTVWNAGTVKGFIAALVLGGALAALGFAGLPQWMPPLLSWVLCLAGAVSFFIRFQQMKAKKPLVYTPRMKRLLACLAGLGLACASLFALGTVFLPLWAMIGIAALLMGLLVPLWVEAATACMAPVEKAVNRWYFNDAARILRERKGMLKIGITGSYGKTSSKMILGKILAEKFRTQFTPSSYNTSMGVTRFVREQLKEDTEVFIAEMGARHVGDIRELCELVQPSYGLLTSVGPQHLETFFTLENVAKTKYELAQSLPDAGVAFFPLDNGPAEALYDRHPGKKVSFGFPREDREPDITAFDVRCTPEGVRFRLQEKDGDAVECVSSLLGRHNVSNILGCAAVARTLGLTMQEISRGIAKVESVEHRLQLIPGRGGVTVIDDAFNSNPAGARAAMEVLAAFPGRHIVVTPGLVELGEEEAERNRAFGAEMADVVHIPILVAGNAAAMEEGLLSRGFPRERILKTATLAEASALLSTLTRAGDVVLFENDLPDQYETK